MTPLPSDNIIWTDDQGTADEKMLQHFFPPQVKLFGNLVNTLHDLHPETSYKLTLSALSFSNRKKIRQKDQDFYNLGIKRSYKFRNKQFNTYSYGMGKEVILVHGWGSFGARWKSYVNRLVNLGYKAIIVDAPAHGTSPGRFLSIPDYIGILMRLFNESHDLYAVVSHSIGGICSTVALNQSIQRKKCKMIYLSAFNSCKTMLNKFSRCIGIKQKIIECIEGWIPKYAGNELSYFSISKHLHTMQADIMLIYDKEDYIVPSTEVLTLLNTHSSIEYIPTFGLGHNLRSDTVVEQVLEFIKG
ncbi:MAG: alpha/beta hydrolase [Flavobacteriaceae bacterium]|nr:alpha/beta hydrolase [Bacteroidia bacterium]MBT8289027.1 alpha/beta hydrolase [Bacteroidia bacterium]NNF74683.1 alpha/beta hydrolase [Flavobacteriaceae bacterium]